MTGHPRSRARAWSRANLFSHVPGVLAAVLLALAPEGAWAEEPVPSLDDQKATTLDVQILGWSADERRYALRVYDLIEVFDEEDGPPACKGYVDHTGKKFLGGLSFVVYEGSRRIGGWRIQDAKKCTPPETARERLAQAKAALAEQGIDLTATGAMLVGDPDQRPSVHKKGKKTESRLTTNLPLPHGPWAGKKLEADCLVEEQEISKKVEGEKETVLRAQATLTLRLVSGKSSAALSKFQLGPSQQPNEGVSWIWSAGFDRALLSPSGKVLVPLAYVHHGDMRLNNKPRILGAPVELAAKLGEAPPPSAPAR